MNQIKQNLLGLTQDELVEFNIARGEPGYRGKQIFQWLYAKGVTDFRSMTDLGKAFRDRLTMEATIEGLTLVTRQCSALDGTTKYLLALPDGLQIESVLIPSSLEFNSNTSGGKEASAGRLTLCVSTQAGCPLGCTFCATATMGLHRNLTAGEIVDQILQVKRISARLITNLVFMGMGEPMLNYENVMKAMEIITTGIGIAARRVTISTAGLADRIRQMGEEKRKVKLAVSLHSAVDDTRSVLMPVNKRYDLASLISAVKYYYACTRQRVTYEHIFFDGVNDTDQEVAALVRYARQVPCKINVIPFHSIAFTRPEGVSATLRPSPRMTEIVNHLRENNLSVFLRSNAGEDIEAACGQLAVQNTKRRNARSNGSPRRADQATILAAT